MHMKHRSQRHIYIFVGKRQHLITTKVSEECSGMQKELAMRKIYTFWITGSTGGVKDCSHCMLIKIRKFDLIRLRLKKALIFSYHTRNLCRNLVGGISVYVIT